MNSEMLKAGVLGIISIVLGFLAVLFCRSIFVYLLGPCALAAGGWGLATAKSKRLRNLSGIGLLLAVLAIVLARII